MAEEGGYRMPPIEYVEGVRVLQPDGTIQLATRVLPPNNEEADVGVYDEREERSARRKRREERRVNNFYERYVDSIRDLFKRSYGFDMHDLVSRRGVESSYTMGSRGEQVKKYLEDLVNDLYIKEYEREISRRALKGLVDRLYTDSRTIGSKVVV